MKLSRESLILFMKFWSSFFTSLLIFRNKRDTYIKKEQVFYIAISPQNRKSYRENAVKSASLFVARYLPTHRNHKLDRTSNWNNRLQKYKLVTCTTWVSLSISLAAFRKQRMACKTNNLRGKFKRHTLKQIDILRSRVRFNVLAEVLE